MNKFNRIIDYLRSNGIYLTNISDIMENRKYKVDAIIKNDTLISIYGNNLFNVLIWNNGVEIVIDKNASFFKYKETDKMINNIRNIISVNSYYNEEYLNRKINSESLDFNLSNKAIEIISFLKPYSVIIDSLNKRRDGFTLQVSLGYIQLIIMYGLDEYYLTVLSNNIEAIESKKIKVIISKLYGEDGMNFWVESKPFYEKLSEILNIYLSHGREIEEFTV